MLHSFGIPDTAGDVWLAYLDSESDKELVIAAVRSFDGLHPLVGYVALTYFALSDDRC